MSLKNRSPLLWTLIITLTALTAWALVEGPLRSSNNPTPPAKTATFTIHGGTLEAHLNPTLAGFASMASCRVNVRVISEDHDPPIFGGAPPAKASRADIHFAMTYRNRVGAKRTVRQEERNIPLGTRYLSVNNARVLFQTASSGGVVSKHCSPSITPASP